MQRTYQLFTLFISALGLLFFTSAAVAPAKVVEENPPVERTTLSKKEMKKQLRQQARIARLEAKMERATNSKRKLRLQKRIQDLDLQKDAEVTILSVLALIFAFVFAPVGLVLAIISRKNGGGIIADIAFWLSIIFMIAFAIWVTVNLATRGRPW